VGRALVRVIGTGEEDQALAHDHGPRRAPHRLVHVHRQLDLHRPVPQVAHPGH